MFLASWAPRIPEVKSGSGPSDGRLGLALLGPPAGSVLTLWAVRRVRRLVGGPAPAVVGGLSELTILHLAVSVLVVVLGAVAVLATALRDSGGSEA